VLERMERVGKKILATWNGRCNLSNTDLDIAHYHGLNPKFVYGALSRFNYAQTRDYFAKLGIVWQVETGGKVFPASGQSSSVLDVIRYELERLGVETRCSAEATAIERVKDGFVLSLSEGQEHRAQRVIIATGGQAAPNLGSNGSGYLLAQKLGHRLIKPFPALVQLKLKADFLKRLAGVKFIGEAELIVAGKSLTRATGEILFADYGLSGPPILELSRTAVEHLAKDEEVLLKLNLINYLSKAELTSFISQRLAEQAGKSLAFSFTGFINKRLTPVLLKASGIKDINKLAGQVTSGERNAIINTLQDWRLTVTGAHSWQRAQVTAGGVWVNEVDQKTLASKLVPGLFFAGEILDIDGDCGGYNLQSAWSSGFIAGLSAATN